MQRTPDKNAVYRRSEEVVSRVIEGELIIVPLTSNIGDIEDELYTLNPTGRDIWERFDGVKRLEQIISDLRKEYDDSEDKIEHDVEGLVSELLKRKMLVEAAEV